MGLIQEIEGLFGIGKKAAQQPQDVAAAQAAATQLKNWLAEGQTVLTVVTPFAASNPVLAAFVGIAQAAITDSDEVVGILQSWIPPANTPTTPATPPASPPAAS
jgi:hypothetical protein